MEPLNQHIKDKLDWAKVCYSFELDMVLLARTRDLLASFWEDDGGVGGVGGSYRLQLAMCCERTLHTPGTTEKGTAHCTFLN